jgi:hypothetical protein
VDDVKVSPVGASGAIVSVPSTKLKASLFAARVPCITVIGNLPAASDEEAVDENSGSPQKKA